ncbi:cyclic peptide export ABC transporter [Herbaspirillum huttiense]|uniref:cyclic peptide export ABC transporter n=1 Tax=Herbaspirillum huttiense TaxID=863372 RepID=UPI0028778BAE|nr:cyclic peptide export ABC transporter [Herbaspirillum huttiense]
MNSLNFTSCQRKKSKIRADETLSISSGNGKDKMFIVPPIVTYLLRRNFCIFLLAIIFGIASGALSIVLIQQINKSLSHADSAIISLVRIVRFSFWLLMSLTTAFISQYFLNRLGRNVLLHLRMHIANSLVHLPLPEMERLGSARISTAMVQDAQTICSAIQSFPNIVINSTVLVAALFYLASLSLKILCVFIIFFCFGIYVHRQITLRSATFLKNVSSFNEGLHKDIQTLTDGMKELKLNRFRRRDFLLNDLAIRVRTSADNNLQALTLFSVASQWGQLVLFSTIGITIFMGRSLISVDASAISAAALTIIYLINPISILLYSSSAFERMRIALTRIASFQSCIEKSTSDMLSEEDAGPDRYPLQCVELSSIHYQYERLGQSGFELGPIDLVIRPGEITFIVGGNGGGKSTLLKILTGLYSPSCGTLTWNGRKIETSRQLEDYRQLFSAIFCDAYLFERVIPSGCAQEDPAMIDVHLAKLQLKGKVSVENGYFTTTDVSQGERKRLALIAACLENRPIFVFDEWAADQDPKFKDIFYYEILSSLKEQGKAVVAITHDEKYFGVADHLVKIEDGRISSCKFS